MNLRVKALIAALLLVVGVTTAMAVFMADNFKKSQTEFISREFSVYSERFRNELIDVTKKSSERLERITNDDEFIRKVIRGRIPNSNKRLEIKEEFNIQITDALRQTQFDLGLAFFDKYVSDRDARDPHIITAYDELYATTCLQRDGPMSLKMQKKFLENKSVRQYIENLYGLYIDGELDKLRRILRVDDKIYLVVSSDLIESGQLAQQNEEQEPVGLFVIFKELSSDWAVKQLPRSNVQSENPVSVVIYSESQLISHSSLSTREAHMLAASIVQGEKHFKNQDQETLIAVDVPFNKERTAGAKLVKNLDKEIVNDLARLHQQLIVYAVILGVIGVVAAYMMANTAVKRVKMLEDVAYKIQNGDFSHRLELAGNDEISHLGKAFNDMNKGLQALGLYTDPDLAMGVVQGDLKVEVDEVMGTIFFTDIADFTAISEKLSSKELVDQLNDYFTIMGEQVKKTGGYLDKFIGDSIMSFWGPPLYEERDHAHMACLSALYCQQAGAFLAEKWHNEGKEIFTQRIGIATGEMVIGNIGSKDKKNFTVIGDDVNLASRLEGANKFYGTSILIDHTTAESVQNEFLIREIDQIYLKGKSVSMRVHELICQLSEMDANQGELVALYSKALLKYRQRDFEEAVELLKRCLKKHPLDGPSHWLKQVCEVLQSTQLGDDWEPITKALEK